MSCGGDDVALIIFKGDLPISPLEMGGDLDEGPLGKGGGGGGGGGADVGDDGIGGGGGNS